MSDISSRNPATARHGAPTAGVPPADFTLTPKWTPYNLNRKGQHEIRYARTVPLFIADNEVIKILQAFSSMPIYLFSLYMSTFVIVVSIALTHFQGLSSIEGKLLSDRNIIGVRSKLSARIKLISGKFFAVSVLFSFFYTAHSKLKRETKISQWLLYIKYFLF